MSFTPCSPEQRRRAVGPLRDLPKELRRAFESKEDFDSLPEPGPQDWLSNHPEEGQTFSQFQQFDGRRPEKTRNTLYLQPLESFSDERSPSLSTLKSWAEAFFRLKVEVLEPEGGLLSDVEERRNPHTGHRQLRTGDLLEILRRGLPGDAFALMGITMTDLYPDPSWNFVFGQASLRDRVGVYSFARYDPRFPVRLDGAAGRRLEGGHHEEADELLLRRSCKVLAHEATHMFGVHHCIYYHCLMNGSNHLAESDARPMHLCPVDLRKLWSAIDFDVVERYRALADFWREQGYPDEVAWLESRLERVTGDSGG